MQRTIILFALLVLLVSFPLESIGKMKGEVKAEGEFLWSTLVRFVRVDCNFEIIEKDSDGAFVIFKYRGIKGTPTCRASVEIIPSSNPQKKKGGSTLQISIPCADTVQEKLFIDGLSKKIEEER